VKVAKDHAWEKDRELVELAVSQILLQQSNQHMATTENQHMTTTDIMSASLSRGSPIDGKMKETYVKEKYVTFYPPSPSQLREHDSDYSTSDDGDNEDEDYNPTSSADKSIVISTNRRSAKRKTSSKKDADVDADAKQGTKRVMNDADDNKEVARHNTSSSSSLPNPRQRKQNHDQIIERDSDSNNDYDNPSKEERIATTPSKGARERWNKILAFRGMANGLNFRPSCDSFCMTRCTEVATPCNKNHSDQLTVYLNHSGEYVLFPSKTYHRGFYSNSDTTLFTAQLFARYKSNDSHRSQRAQLHDVYYKHQKLEHETVTELCKDLILYWDTLYGEEQDDDQVYVHTTPTKYKNQAVDKACNRVIDLEKNPSMQTGLKNLLTRIEELYPNLNVVKVWLLKKFKEGDGFPTWHQDLVNNADVTIVVNVGAYNTSENDQLHDKFSESLLWFYSHCEVSYATLHTTVPMIEVAKWTMEYVKVKLDNHRVQINQHLLMSTHFKTEQDEFVNRNCLISFLRIITEKARDLQKDVGFTEVELMRYHQIALTSSNAKSTQMRMSEGGANLARDSEVEHISVNEPLHETTSNTKQGGSTERRDSGIPEELQQANDNNTRNKKHPESETKVRKSWIFA
jgi:hypothetical protein